MRNKKRNDKVRLMIKKVNEERKKQAKKIDIVCNNLVDAQREFIKRLDVISFTANFYKSIIGITDLNTLFYVAGHLLKEELDQANIAFFTNDDKNFKLHIPESQEPIDLSQQRLENHFTDELVSSVSKLNKVCTIEDLLQSGLQVNPAQLSKIWAVTIPLCHHSASFGFILIYREKKGKKELTEEQLNCVKAITLGLCRAITSCKTLLHSSN